MQLRTYAEATIRASDVGVPSETIERDVDLRMQRKERIQAKTSLALNVILDESVLHRWTGGPEVLRSQLLHGMSAKGARTSAGHA
ncbi:MAG TPA: Scr1 family TA system antitoxin-like transcriptional regulator [Candidatus Limnocylindrales bacterium]|nr:Scr1 family TA system antitoxin-like transcriptional regulator [Candidatus Limnocylindrales bacterium]